MREIHFIRHGESESNAGLRSDWPDDVRLTAKGRRQAESIVPHYEATPPDLIVISPYIRTADTAAPMIARYPQVPRETWPVQEFTYLAPAAQRNTTFIERGPAVEAYWERRDPHYVDGEGAESLAMLVGRVRETLVRIDALDCSRVLIYSHGFFLSTLLWHLLFEPRLIRLPEPNRLRQFVRATSWPNGAILTCRFSKTGEHAIGARRIDHLPTE